ncbi:hypothetical protein M378DRAFT_72594 [Amanita muscaria Koide BX008]|uniref:Uncharacterized protein n=1 Tax=Amanita muscaria (strain Koide BX008) TaxID=946122 RepID=A0A0C2X235_AMAMK|nr:hypothetical protein M378DRAFT_72594 [Amanita muscaria Koide BX008]
MKSLRKSLTGGGRDSHTHRPLISTPVPLPSVSKPPSSILPPSKVIRAISAYRPQAPQELPFQKGDFFYVLNDDGGQWYEAHNPVTGSRGLVPRNMFEEFNKSVSPYGSFSLPSLQLPATPRGTKIQVYYAIVQHDFVAERQDELDAKRGEAITVVAQSNREWFVAKPIGKLGRPGLIPVAFVQIHDPMTGQPIENVEELIDSGALPKVDEWKRAMITYKQNSITLGVIESPTSTPSPRMPTSSEPDIQVEGPTPTKPIYPPESSLVPPSDCLPDGMLLSAEVVSFHHEMNEYWFRVDAVFQPYGSVEENLPSAKRLILFRAYTDFYDFQVSLLETFPHEAGRVPPHPRVLPYMPGPAEEVDDGLTANRREELDVYIRNLCDLSKDGYRYILEHIVIRQFLALKPGDIENVVKPRVDELEALPPSIRQGDYPANGLQDRFSKLKVHSNGRAKSDASEYEDDEGYAPSPKVPPKYGDGERRPSQESTTRLHSQLQGNHQRAESAASFYPTSSYVHSRSRSTSPQQFDSPGNDSTYQSNYAAVQHPNHQSGSYTHAPKPSISSSHTTSSRSRSQAMAAPNINSPPISAANPQTAFVKIKIFNTASDDLIAIRVHPRVSHAELMHKVNARLGSEVAVLKFRDSMNSFVGLASDEDLRVWMETADKHVLFAE